MIGCSLLNLSILSSLSSNLWLVESCTAVSVSKGKRPSAQCDGCNHVTLIIKHKNTILLPSPLAAHTWYVLSKLSYMNLVIRDVFPTARQEKDRLNGLTSKKLCLVAFRHTECKLTVELLAVVSVMVVTAAEKELIKEWGDDLEGQGASRSGCNYSPDLLEMIHSLCTFSFIFNI